jgi:hypothetical protein
MTKIHRELKLRNAHSLRALRIDKRIILTVVNYTCNSELNRKDDNKKTILINVYISDNINITWNFRSSQRNKIAHLWKTLSCRIWRRLVW